MDCPLHGRLGVPNLSPLEVLILHIVRHRNRAKKFADISPILDIEEVHLVNYALRSLRRRGWSARAAKARRRWSRSRPLGADVCTCYMAVREQLLVSRFCTSGLSGRIASLSGVGEMLRAVSGYYNQAARSAATV